MSGCHLLREKGTGNFLASQTYLRVLPAGGSVALWSEQRLCQQLGKEVDYRNPVGPQEDPRKSLTQVLPHGCYSVSLESSVYAAQDCRQEEREGSFSNLD